ncbi:unnamed protein product [Acanthoscelides obtectus]|uniref:Uncharacterized protein n=1 Tax=Acanthoscelides obtectus TaxID=200917 RepID=A0A9P0KV52_ACAOB|nr:unnamed protein product [Acanthoscelides obtectus]CAK1639230.1 hypothetical protein AOBTE_LOCUS11058 [Acanthoscelides obtectus]
MYELYRDENKWRHTASMSTYGCVFKTLNLSFHHPKKDQCSLFLTYRNANDEAKITLEEKYNKHISEKKRVSYYPTSYKSLDIILFRRFSNVSVRQSAMSLGKSKRRDYHCMREASSTPHLATTFADVQRLNREQLKNEKPGKHTKNSQNNVNM